MSYLVTLEKSGRHKVALVTAAHSADAVAQAERRNPGWRAVGWQ